MTTRSAQARDVYEQHVRALPRDVQLQLVAVIADEVVARPAPESDPPRRLLDLVGLGAEIWAGVDASEYVNEMRDEWDRPR